MLPSRHVRTQREGNCLQARKTSLTRRQRLRAEVEGGRNRETKSQMGGSRGEKKEKEEGEKRE